MSVSEVGTKVERSGSPGWVKVGVGLGALGLALWVVRWLIQGADTIYTDTARAFWVPGARPGIWLETTDRWVWLGLEGLGAVVAIVVGTLTMLWLASRVRKPALKRVATWLSRAGAVVAMAAPILPVWAFVSGMPPEGAQRLVPLTTTPTAIDAAPAAALSVPTGQWVLADASANLLAARVKAGGETFDAKFGPVTVAVDVAADLAASKATFDVPSASVSTGVELRNSHAQGYLAADQHPKIGFAITKLATLGAGADAQSRAFSTEGVVTLMGKTLTVPVTGTLALLSEKEGADLGVHAPQALLIDATFVLPVKSTPLDPANFDVDQLPITARFVLVPAR